MILWLLVVACASAGMGYLICALLMSGDIEDLKCRLHLAEEDLIAAREAERRRRCRVWDKAENTSRGRRTTYS